MEERNFDFGRVPEGFALCFSTECPLREECMRHLAGRHAPDTLTRGLSVFPNAYRHGQCCHYRPIRPIKAARGFGDILANVRRSDYSTMRAELVKYLGTGGTFYRYRNGERLLTPEQQEWMRQLLRRYGYEDDVQFNSYVMTYDFT